MVVESLLQFAIIEKHKENSSTALALFRVNLKTSLLWTKAHIQNEAS